MLAEYKTIIKQHWRKLAGREQKIIMAGITVVAILLLYTLLWEPFTNSITTSRRSVTSKQALAVWMQHAIPRLQVLRKSGLARKSIGDESLLTFLDSSSRKANMHSFISKLAQSTDQKQVTITLTQVPFDSLIAWLTSLWKSYGITVQAASFHTLPQAGMVRANLTVHK